MNRTSRWFWAIVVAQAVFLLTWAGWHQYVRSHAPVIRLKTAPVDPTDLLRGDYMILRYEISSVSPPAPVAGKGSYEDFWVTLEPRGGYYVAVAASWDKPRLSDGRIAVLASRSHRGGANYGIETYYVPQGKGTPRFKTLEVDAAVSPTSRLYIRRLLLDGRAYP